MKPDRKALAVGTLASLLLIVAMFLTSPLLDGFRAGLLPDAGADWYYWKLPSPDSMARLTAWGAFILHLILVWYFLYRLRSSKHASDGAPNRWNIALLWTNLLFAALHILQSILWYDGLAQDTPVWSSQGSVIVMLVLILILENGRRGLFFGRKAPLPKEGVRVITRFHGYYIALATIFTFWFHPTETTPGHLFGFFYMFLLFLQISLAYTPIHRNPIWTFVLEILVLFHGTTIAIQQALANPAARPIWPMFLFGFSTLFIVTQIHGLRLSRRAIAAWSILYAALAIGVYSGLLFGVRTFGSIHEVLWIPIIEYLLTFVLAVALWIPGRLLRLRTNVREGAEY